MSTTPPPENPTPPPEGPEQQNWWQGLGKGNKAAVVVLTLVGVFGAIGAIGSSSEDTDREAPNELTRAELRASAKELDPKQLDKDPDRYADETVVMRGEIIQIREGEDIENFLLMATECKTEFLPICDGPTVHVTYDMPTDKTEEDIVTVYGTVTGGYEYETQIGSSNYVGSIHAEIIE